MTGSGQAQAAEFERRSEAEAVLAQLPGYARMGWPPRAAAHPLCCVATPLGAPEFSLYHPRLVRKHCCGRPLGSRQVGQGTGF